MAENSKITWTDHTFNPWLGCAKVSKGCKHCYAETLTSGRMGRDVFGAVNKRQRTSLSLWRKPIKWNRDAEASGKPTRVFCASLADFFEDAPGPNEWRPEVWDLIRECPWLDFQILTKRPENIAAMLPDDWAANRWSCYPNVWLGTSIEDREVVDRARTLVDVPAIVHFISYEPALGPVFGELPIPLAGGYEDNDLIPEWPDGYDGPELDLHDIEWLICGGESGPGFRPMELRWAQEARRRCEFAGIAYFFKQIAAYKNEQGADALGAIIHEFPKSWDRAELRAGQEALL